MRPPHRRLALGALLTPILFVGYVLVLGALTLVNDLGWVPSDHSAFSLIDPLATVATVVVLAVFGVTTVFTWSDGLRVTAGATVVALFVGGAEGAGPVGNPPILVGLYVGVLLVAGAELAAYDRIDVDIVTLGCDVGRTGLAVGVGHAALALTGFAIESGDLPSATGNLNGVVLVGLSALLTAVVGFVDSVGSYPYAASVGVNPIVPPPSPGYLVKWAVPLVAVLVLVGLEYGVRRLLDVEEQRVETVSP